MRILHVTDAYRPAIGGLERAVAALGEFQASSGQTVHVLTSAFTGQPDRELINGVHVHRAPLSLQKLPVYSNPEHVFHPTMTDPLFTRAIRSVVDEVRPDVIHCHGWSLYSALKPARDAGVPVVVTAHDYGHLCALKTLQRNGKSCPGPSVTRCLPCAADHYGPARGIPLATALLASGRRHKQASAWTGISESLASHGVTRSGDNEPPMRVIPSYVPDPAVDVPDGTPRPDYAPADGDYLMFVGQLGPHKGLNVLLDAYDIVRAERADAPPLVVVGTPRPDTPALDRPGVIVAMNQPHTAVMAGWKHSLIGIVPSVWAEPFGQVAVEAGAVGIPVIATRTGGLTDIVQDGVSGLLVEPGDVEELAHAINRLLDDPQLRAKMSEKAPRYAYQFVLSAVAPKIEALYEEVVMDARNRTAR